LSIKIKKLVISYLHALITSPSLCSPCAESNGGKSNSFVPKKLNEKTMVDMANSMIDLGIVKKIE
jgi:hypothetical protein